MSVSTDSMNVIAGWLIDGTGEPGRRDVLVRIRGGIIESIERIRPDDMKSLDLPILDLSHCTILPGLVDCHVHLSMSGTCDPNVRQFQLGYNFEQAAPVISGHLRQHIHHGVVAVREGGDSAAHALRFKNERFADEGIPIHLKCAGKAWRARGRYGRLVGRPPADGHTLAECIARQEEKADHVKIINSGLNSLKEFGKETPPQFSAEEMESAVRAARGRGMKVMVHANGRIPVRDSVDAGCHSIEHGFFMGRENIERMANLHVFWVPTAFSMKAYSFELEPGSIETEISARNLEHQLDQLAQARSAGVHIALGTDSGGLGIHHGASLADELKLLIQAGFGLEEAVRCTTLNGARLLDLDNELGQLKQGMPATFLVLKGAPPDLTESLKTPEQVYIRGRRSRILST